MLNTLKKKKTKNSATLLAGTYPKPGKKGNLLASSVAFGTTLVVLMIEHIFPTTGVYRPCNTSRGTLNKLYSLFTDRM